MRPVVEVRFTERSQTRGRELEDGERGRSSRSVLPNEAKVKLGGFSGDEMKAVEPEASIEAPRVGRLLPSGAFPEKIRTIVGSLPTRSGRQPRGLDPVTQPVEVAICPPPAKPRKRLVVIAVLGLVIIGLTATIRFGYDAWPTLTAWWEAQRLASLLRSPDPTAAEDAAWSLIDLGPAGESILLQAVHDRDDKVRSRACRWLPRTTLEPTRIIEAETEALSDPVTAVPRLGGMVVRADGWTRQDRRSGRGTPRELDLGARRQPHRRGDLAPDGRGQRLR